MREMGRMIDFVEDNFNIIQILFSKGKVSHTLLNEYHIYQEFLKTKHIKSKMQRYSDVSETLNISERTVRKAVENMEREV
jgi:uncharacterized protein YktA (UPF0223 family)